MLDSDNAFEILVIDNNSSDNTKNVVESFLPKIKNLRYIFEQNQGLSYARNRGIKEASGEVCAFLDDDMRLDIDYFRNLMQVIEEKEGIYAFGGKIIPEWGNLKRPNWLGPDGDRSITKGPLGDHDFGDVEGFYGEGRLHSFAGGNFFLHRFIFDKIGLLRTDLGVTGNKRFLGEETDLFFRIREKGYPVMYAPSVSVFHPVLESQLNKTYFKNWYEACGRSVVVMKPDLGSKKLFLVPRYLFRNLVFFWIKYLMFSLAYDSFKSFYWGVQVSYLKGVIKQYRGT
jgi:glucosyl-dolichyl phosphate glucuronosyltransferase